MTPQNHTRFIIGCITFLASIAMLSGGWLLWKGFAGGGELIMTGNTAIAGMLGFLSNRPNTPTTQSGAVATEVVNTQAQPVQVQDQHNP